MKLTRTMAETRIPAAILSLALIQAGCAAAVAPPRPVATEIPDTTRRRVVEAFGRRPLVFEVNQGQTDGAVKFIARSAGYTLFLTPTDAVLVTSGAKPGSAATPDGAEVRITLVGANPHPQLTGLEEQAGRVHHFTGSDPARWRTNVLTYAQVRYEAVYPGIDLIYHGKHRHLEFDFVVAPGADPQTITFGLHGAQRIDIDAHGDLLAQTAGGPLRLHKPVIYQELDTGRRRIAGAYILRGPNRVSFWVDRYDTSRPLVIDPVLGYATTVLGASAEEVHAVAVDAAGSAYLTGGTFPFSGPSTSDAFVAKLSPSGSTLVYTAYFGGSGVERGSGIAVEPSGTAYVTGATTSNDFPGVSDVTVGGATDAFIAQFNPSGVLSYSHRFGGNGDDEGLAIALVPGSADPTLHGTGNVYIAGATTSTNLPVSTSAIQPNNAGGMDAFLALVPFSGVGFPGLIRFYDFLTYLGGAGEDAGTAIAADATGNGYVTGFTFSTNFPTTSGAYQLTPGGDGDAFVAKVHPSFGPALRYSTYLGGQGVDHGRGIAVDIAGNVYVAGFTGRFANCGQAPPLPYCRTDLNDFPTTPGAFQATSPEAPDNTISSFGDAFVTKLNATGSALVYSTYFGGSLGDGATGIAVDRSGNAYVIGFTTSADFPAVNPVQSATATVSGFSDAFVAKVSPAGSALVYSTYLGGTDSDSAGAIALDATGNAYTVGTTRSSDFPTVNPLQPNGPRGHPRPFIGKINASDSATAAPGDTVTVSTAPGVAGQAGVSATLTNASGAGGGDMTVTVENFSTNPGTTNVIDVGGGFVDLKVSGATDCPVSPCDTVTAKFYYPSTVQDWIAQLLYFDGSSWRPVLSDGPTSPAWDQTDNLDGTISGGRFTVVFGQSSQPKITELTGTVFTPAFATVADALAALRAHVASLPGERGIRVSLSKKLDNAARSLQGNRRQPAISQLSDFEREVETFERLGRISATAAAVLTAIARAIITVL